MRPYISVIIPAYNEETRISRTLKRIIRYFNKKGHKHEIIVVDDGSTDSTIKVVKNLKNRNIKILKNKVNKGKGFSVRKGMLAGEGDYLLFTDADLSTPIEELDKFLNYTDYDIIIGSRALKESKVTTKSHKKLLGKAANLLINLLAVRGIKDTQCGFKLFKQKIAKQLFSRQLINRFGFDFEILFLAQKKGYSIKELPVMWVNAEGSKVKPTDYFRTFGELLKIRINQIKGKYN
jgi:dolichyl-phosphate beta-glucosyltransferase